MIVSLHASAFKQTTKGATTVYDGADMLAFRVLSGFNIILYLMHESPLFRYVVRLLYKIRSLENNMAHLVGLKKKS